jgi:ribosomal protein S2
LTNNQVINQPTNQASSKPINRLLHTIIILDMNKAVQKLRKNYGVVSTMTQPDMAIIIVSEDHIGSISN